MKSEIFHGREPGIFLGKKPRIFLRMAVPPGEEGMVFPKGEPSTLPEEEREGGEEGFFCRYFCVLLPLLL